MENLLCRPLDRYSSPLSFFHFSLDLAQCITIHSILLASFSTQSLPTWASYHARAFLSIRSLIKYKLGCLWNWGKQVTNTCFLNKMKFISWEIENRGTQGVGTWWVFKVGMNVQRWVFKPGRGENSPLADRFWKKAVPIGHLFFSILAISQEQIARNYSSQEEELIKWCDIEPSFF